MFPYSSSAISTNENDFRDLYAIYKDATFPGVDGNELFIYFYNNIFDKILVCNPWKKNLAKLIFSEVFVNIDQVKAKCNWFG